MYYAKGIKEDFTVFDVALGDEFETLEEIRNECEMEREASKESSTKILEFQIMEDDEDGIARLVEKI